MLSTLKTVVPSHLYARLKPAIHAARRHIARLDRFVDRRRLSRSQFMDLLEDLGFHRGATVMAHSSMRAIRRRVPDITAEELIQLLQFLLTPEGTLLMPIFPFAGKQAAFVADRRRFDVLHAPSRTGALTEVFRTTPGVIRSIHPTHPVAAWGRHARELVGAHHEGSTFGMNSPFYKLREYDGAVVGLGTRMRNAFTIIHVAEDLHPVSRALAFEPDLHQVMVDAGFGDLPYELQVMRPDVTREYKRVERILLSEGILRYVRAQGLQCASTKADAFISRTLELAAENEYLLRSARS